MIWRAATLLLAIALLALAIPAVRHLREQPPPVPPAVHAALEPPAGSDLGAGDDVLDAAVSPDGGEMVFVATTDGAAQLWRTSLDSGRTSALRGTEGAAMPAWKRGGGVVSFFAGGRLRQISLADGAVRDLATAASPRGAAWLPDGSVLFAPEARGPIRRLRNGLVSDATTLRGGDEAHTFPESVGDDGDFLYVAQVAGGRRIVRLVRNGGEIDLTRTSGHAVLLDDVLLHVSENVLMAQRFDNASGALVGRGTPLAFNVGVSESGRAFFTASRRVIAWAEGARRARELVWLDAGGQRLGSLAEPGDYWQVRLSPDERIAAVTMTDPLLRTLDVVALPAAADAAPGRRVTESLSADSDPVWSPDGSRIVFRSMHEGQPNLFARPPQYAAQPNEVVLRSELDETPTDWRGDTVLFHATRKGTRLDVWALDRRSGQARQVTRGFFNEWDARWSPDGRWIAYVSDESGEPQIVVQRWPEGGRVARATGAGGTRPRWRRTGTSLLFMRGSTLMETAMTATGFTPARPVAELPGLRDYEVARRSDRLLAIVPGARSRTPRAGMIIDWPR